MRLALKARITAGTVKAAAAAVNPGGACQRCAAREIHAASSPPSAVQQSEIRFQH
ncbi:MAG: hypothetical protein Q8L13_21920 [Bradyrhizobium sp.]|uniref:hypothetical protein n=1 Tax=Bradyrhizobium sp. TaxID=376 RepID=UPI00272EFFFA|nr:hypothetical protein [Bradyrhizobium sp.]MDP1868981.1 hypothetical protein [Bradyrhizobium sp.]